jgi:putative endonuclease
MAFYAYILKCADGKYYTGHTDDLEKRIGQHQSGLIKGYTSTRLPVELVWTQDFSTRYEALDAELKIKGWSQAKKEALINGDWNRLSFFAKPPSERGAMLPGVSTSLDTNGDVERGSSIPFVSSEVETPLSPTPPNSHKPKPPSCP